MGIVKATMGILSKKEDMKVDNPRVIKLKKFKFSPEKLKSLEDIISINPFSTRVPAKIFNPIRKKIILQSI